MHAPTAHLAANQGGFPVDWTEEFYDMLQNKVGGGKPKMRWYFGQNGWPTSSVLGCVRGGDGSGGRADDVLVSYWTWDSRL